MMDCVFCRIANGKIPTEIVYQDEKVVAFRDAHPVAPVHILVIPRQHIDKVADLTEAQMPVICDLVRVANQLAVQEKTENGYRLVINNGKTGGQHIFHLHLHLIGGRQIHNRDVV